MKKFRFIIIEGRRWFQKSAGNTYHSVTVTVKHARKADLVLKSGRHYGYGEMYLQTAHALLAEAGYFSDEYSAFCIARKDRREEFYITAHDVAREKDL